MKAKSQNVKFNLSWTCQKLISSFSAYIIDNQDGKLLLQIL